MFKCKLDCEKNYGLTFKAIRDSIYQSDFHDADSLFENEDGDIECIQRLIKVSCPSFNAKRKIFTFGMDAKIDGYIDFDGHKEKIEESWEEIIDECYMIEQNGLITDTLIGLLGEDFDGDIPKDIVETIIGEFEGEEFVFEKVN